MIDKETATSRFLKIANQPAHWILTLMENPSELRTVMEEEIPGAPDRPCWVFFTDLDPSANWGHRCLYTFMLADTGLCFVRAASWPPAERFPRYGLNV